MSRSGDIMSTLGDVQYIGGYHEYIGGCSVHRDFQYKSKDFINLFSHMNHDIPLNVLKMNSRVTVVKQSLKHDTRRLSSRL